MFYLGTVLQLEPYLQFSQHRMVLDAGEQNPHGVRAVVQVRDAGPVQIARQLVDVRLKLSKGWRQNRHTSNMKSKSFIETVQYKYNTIQ